ncbi:aminoglycoside phosphotransferase family protein [Kitasatospora sp. NPDC059646]|uniref:aminoglycoside phosphotransferase family protein n=1 Tax=Kitasatospora sp. NPDC059646 TaxID=3346893 RepID=UPI0036740733
MTAAWTTHHVELLPDTVRKRFRPTADTTPSREWRALTLLARHAPGLATRPLSLTGRTVTMTRLPGLPLRGTALTDRHLDALARTVDRLLHAVPPGAAAALLAGCATAVPVLGQADGNLANHLWDGAEVRLVDFEDSGRSDRPYEPAELVEHVSARVDTDLDAAAFLSRFALPAVESARLRECRRLFALLWLVFLAGDPATAARNPPGTGGRQAGRLLGLLGLPTA